MGADEWADWLAFHAHYDLPDAFLTTGQLGALIAGVVGSKSRPGDFAPYYKGDGPEAKGNLGEFLAFVKAVQGGTG